MKQAMAAAERGASIDAQVMDGEAIRGREFADGLSVLASSCFRMPSAVWRKCAAWCVAADASRSPPGPKTTSWPQNCAGPEQLQPPLSAQLRYREELISAHFSELPV